MLLHEEDPSFNGLGCICPALHAPSPHVIKGGCLVMSRSGDRSWHEKDIILQQPRMGKQTELYTHMPLGLCKIWMKRDTTQGFQAKG